MPAPSSAELVAALDRDAVEIEQVMAVLRWAGHEPRELSLAVGDRLLLGLAEQLTTAPIELTAECPDCGETNVISLSTSTVAEHAPRTRLLGRRRGVREPTYGDLLDLPADPERAVDLLGRRCTIGPVDPAEAADALDDVDGSLAGPLDLACVECGRTVLVEADGQQLALDRLHRHVDEVERDIHLLASSYGWALDTIEALPDARRQRFVRLIEAGR